MGDLLGGWTAQRRAVVLREHERPCERHRVGRRLLGHADRLGKCRNSELERLAAGVTGKCRENEVFLTCAVVESARAADGGDSARFSGDRRRDGPVRLTRTAWARYARTGAPIRRRRVLGRLTAEAARRAAGGLRKDVSRHRPSDHSRAKPNSITAHPARSPTARPGPRRLAFGPAHRSRTKPAARGPRPASLTASATECRRGSPPAGPIA